MPKNLSIEFTKIEDFIMEDERYNNLDDWYNHVIKDLGDVAYRKTNGELRTDIQHKTNIQLNTVQSNGLKEDLNFRFEKKGETNRLIEIERRLIGKYRIDIVDDDTKQLRQAVLDKFIEHFNKTDITNKYDPQKRSIEESTKEEELSFEDAIRRSLIIASINSNKKLAMGQVMATLINHPIKGIDKKDFARTAGSKIPEFISFSKDLSIDDLKDLLDEEFPNFDLEEGDKGEEENISEIEYFFPMGDHFPTLVYYENKTLNKEGEVRLRNLIRKFNVKKDENLMEIYNWMISFQPEGPEYPKSSAGSYIVVLTNRPSSQIRMTTGTPWATQGSCAAINATAGGNRRDGRDGYVSGWTGFTDLRNMNMIAFIFANTKGKDKSSNLNNINPDWPIVWDDTLQGRIVLRWGYVSDLLNTGGTYNFKIGQDEYDSEKRIGFSVETFYGMQPVNTNKTTLTSAVFAILNSGGLSERNWESLATPHLHIGATDRSKPPHATGGGLSSYGKQLYTTKQKTINSVYYLDEDIDVLDEQKSIAMSNTLSIGQAMSMTKRRSPVEVRVILAQNPRIWLYPNAVKELFSLKDHNTNMILLSSPLCNQHQLLQFFNHLNFYNSEEQIQLINNILNNTSFDIIVEQRLINYLEVNHRTFDTIFNKSKTYKSLNNELKLSYSLVLLLKGLQFNEKSFLKGKLIYLPYSEQIVTKLVQVLLTLSKTGHMKVKKRKIKTSRDEIIKDYLELSNMLLFAKNTSVINYTRVVNILKRNLDVLREYHHLDNTLTNILFSYMIDYRLIHNNKVRDYYFALIDHILMLEIEIPEDWKKGMQLHYATIKNYILDNTNNMSNFRNRQVNNEGSTISLPDVKDFIDLTWQQEIDFGKVGTHDEDGRDFTYPSNHYLGLLLLLNSNEKTLQHYNTTESVYKLAGVSSMDMPDEMKLQLLSNTINFENENYVGDKLIRNPLQRIELFKNLKDKEEYLKLYYTTLRDVISTSLKDNSINFFKSELESYLITEIMENKLYDFNLIRERNENDKVSTPREINTILLTNYLTSTEQINLLFNKTVAHCFGELYSYEVDDKIRVLRNPLPRMNLEHDIEENFHLQEIIVEMQNSEDWINIDNQLFADNLNFSYENQYFGFCNNPRLPEDIQNYILLDLPNIAEEYGIYQFNTVFGTEMQQLTLSQNNNLSKESIGILMNTKVNMSNDIKRNLAKNGNTPLNYLISDNIENKNTLLDSYPYEVLLNSQIEQEDFYNVYNYIFRLLTTNIDDNVFNMNQFIVNNLEPLLSVEKGIKIRTALENTYNNFRKDIYYWRGGFNLARKFSQTENINYWLMEGGQGGIADNPIMPSKELQIFSVLKWDSDKSKRKIININEHKYISETLVYIEGTEIYFDDEGHLQHTPITDNIEIDELFGYIPVEERVEREDILFCNTCLERTTLKGSPVKHRLENQEAVDKHKLKKHKEGEMELLPQPAKMQKWTHECIFVTIDKYTHKQDIRIPDWRYQLTQETFSQLLNTIGIRLGALAMFDRVYKTLPIECSAGNTDLRYQLQDMLKNINQVHAWSVEFIDDNLELLCHQMNEHYSIIDMWSNFIFTDNFIEHALSLYTHNPQIYSDLIIYLLYNIELNRIDYSQIENLVLNIQDIETLLLLNRFLSEVKF